MPVQSRLLGFTDRFEMAAVRSGHELHSTQGFTPEGREMGRIEVGVDGRALVADLSP